jgi:hypothetical protein
MVGIKLEDLGRAQYPLGSGLALGGRTLYMGKVSWIDDRPLSLLLSQMFIVKLTPYLMCTLK